jgi:hypothetical protein
VCTYSKDASGGGKYGAMAAVRLQRRKVEPRLVELLPGVQIMPVAQIN